MEDIVNTDNSKNRQIFIWQERDFHSIILEILQKATSNDKPRTREDELGSALLKRVLRAARRFGEGAAELSKAFLWSAATGQPIVRGNLSPLCSPLHQEIKLLLAQLTWLEREQESAEATSPKSLEAAQTLAIAVKLRILQRAATYCRHCGETTESSPRLERVEQMYHYYLSL